MGLVQVALSRLFIFDRFADSNELKHFLDERLPDWTRTRSSSGGLPRIPEESCKTFGKFSSLWAVVLGGAVGRAVAFNTTNPRFESSHWQYYLPSSVLKTVLKRRNKEKVAGNDQIKKKLFVTSIIYLLFLLWSEYSTLSVLITDTKWLNN